MTNKSIPPDPATRAIQADQQASITAGHWDSDAQFSIGNEVFGLNKLLDERDDLLAERNELRAENTSLQDQAFDLTERLYQAGKEIERLHGEASLLAEALHRAQAENERLRADNDELQIRLGRNHPVLGRPEV